MWSKKYEEAQRERWMWVQAVVYHESKIKVSKQYKDDSRMLMLLN
jgi:hypothetical protein